MGSALATRVLPSWQGQSMGGTTLAGHGGLCCCLCWEWWWKEAPSVFIQAPMTIPAHPISTEIPRGLAVNKRQCASRLAWKLARDASHLATYRSVMHMTHIAAITLQWTCYCNTHPDKHQTNLQLNWRFSLLKRHPQPDVHQTSERDPCQPADSGRADRYENRRDSPPLSPSQADGSGISGAAPIRPLLGLRLFSSALGLAAAHINFANHLEGEENQFVFSFPKMTWRQPFQTKAQNYAVLPSNCLTFFFDF